MADNTTIVKATAQKGSPVEESPPRKGNRFLAKAAKLRAKAAKLLAKAAKLLSQWAASPWRWATVTCVLLAISGGVRTWRDWGFDTLSRASESCPFPLSNIPTVLGTWRAIEGSEKHLDAEIARIAGSSDHVIRAYQDETTGEIVQMIVLYGPATSVFSHTPDVCYPAAGYKVAGSSSDDHMTVSGSETIPVSFRRAFFSKKSGAVEHDVEVCSTFLHDKKWLPEVASQWKTFRMHPAMLKIQLQRTSSNVGLADSPTDSLLKELVREIDRRIALKAGPTANEMTPAGIKSRPG